MNLGKYAGVAELADAPDLGSGGIPVQVQVLSPAPKKQSTLRVLFFFGYRYVTQNLLTRPSSLFLLVKKKFSSGIQISKSNGQTN